MGNMSILGHSCLLVYVFALVICTGLTAHLKTRYSYGERDHGTRDAKPLQTVFKRTRNQDAFESQTIYEENLSAKDRISSSFPATILEEDRKEIHRSHRNDIHRDGGITRFHVQGDLPNISKGEQVNKFWWKGIKMNGGSLSRNRKVVPDSVGKMTQSSSLKHYTNSDLHNTLRFYDYPSNDRHTQTSSDKHKTFDWRDSYTDDTDIGRYTERLNSQTSNGPMSGKTFISNKTISELLPAAQRRLSKLNDDGNERKFVTSFSPKWNPKDLQFTTITVGSLMLFLIFVVMILALRVHCRNREKTAQEWIRHPIVQPSTATSDAVQPHFKQLLTSGQLSGEPIRIKAKGLLERRGSNTSLTIDLGPSAEGASDAIFSPSKECTQEDFLMTAGSRISRRQLRLCLRDPRDLHAEFWQIPTNHPDKCSVPGAAAKNRYRTVLPNEDTRVVLRNVPPDSPETPASQYINANYIKGYDGEEKAYIATQGPLAHTIEDLWLLVMQERCPAMVMITRLKEKGRVKCEPYVPNYSATFGSVQVTVKQVIQKNGYTIRQILLKRGDEIHTTLHFWFTSWPDHKAPSSARYLLAMAAEVEASRKESPRRPVAVHCSAGIGRTGCFIAISIGIHQLLEEDCTDVLSIVCQMRLDRGGMVQTAEQYEFIHRALAFYEATLPSTSSTE